MAFPPDQTLYFLVITIVMNCGLFMRRLAIKLHKIFDTNFITPALTAGKGLHKPFSIRLMSWNPCFYMEELLNLNLPNRFLFLHFAALQRYDMRTDSTLLCARMI